MTEARLATQLGSLRAARMLLRRLGVPVHDGAFSPRLFSARLETRTDPQASPLDRAAGAIARHGFVLMSVHRGRRIRLRLKATADRLVGPGDVRHPDGSSCPPLVVKKGEVVAAALHICTMRNAAQSAAFNLRGLAEPDAPPIYFMFVVAEDRLFVAQRDELLELHAACGRGERTPMFSMWRDGLRINLPRSATRLDADYCIRGMGET